jgi:hypothetical protein
MHSDDPTLNVKRPKIKTTGWRTWTEEDIAAFEVTHPIGTQARLAMARLVFRATRAHLQPGASPREGADRPNRVWLN